jgi:SAM-dependent methyltransferase
VENSLIYRNCGNTTLLDMLGPVAGRVLDCGCGAGDNAAILSRAGWQVTGITIDPAERDAASPFCAAIVVADLDDGLTPEVGDGFDAILFSHVLEHLKRPDVLLRGARSRLGPNGVIAVALPNVLHYRQRASFLKGDFNYTDTGMLDRTHLRFYTVTTGRKLLQEAGYEILDARPEGGLPWRGLRKLVPSGLRRRLDSWALRTWPNLFAWQSLFIARVDRRGSK